MATPTTGEYIPGDLITEILIRLPVKSLLRCKSVCKPWLSLITNPKFVKSHIKHTITTPGADQTVIVKGGDDYSLSVLHLDSPQIRAPLGLPFSRGDYSLKPCFKLVGSCNGILCVSVSGAWYDKDIPDIYLWNPATKQSKLIPPHNLCDKYFSAALGFGFDPLGNDYKVVRIVHFMGDNNKPKPRATEVYSANANVWQEVKPDLSEDEDSDSFINVPEDFPEDDRFDVCVNGLLCCLGYYGMMAFDLNTEVFTIGVNLPTDCSDACFSNFNDTIAVITSQKDERNHTLWMLDNEACLRGGAVKALWTVMLTVDVDFPVWRVCGCFNSGDFVFYTEDRVLLLYNSHKKEARNAPVSINIGIYHQIIKYNESLVSIRGSKQVDLNATDRYNSCAKHLLCEELVVCKDRPILEGELGI